MRQVTIQQADSKAEELTVLKANLHTHTTNSDGTFSPSEVIGFYADAGYDVLAFTDHRTTNHVSEYDAEGMTLLSGIELHPAGPRGIPWHILAIGIPENFSCTHPESGQQAVDAVRQAGGVAFAAHPYWCGFTAAEVMTLNGIAGIEVYNTSTRYIGKEYNMTIWDETLDAGRNYTALAVDDVHGKPDLFRGWTMICAKADNARTFLMHSGTVHSMLRRDRNFTSSLSTTEFSRRNSLPAPLLFWSEDNLPGTVPQSKHPTVPERGEKSRRCGLICARLNPAVISAASSATPPAEWHGAILSEYKRLHSC